MDRSESPETRSPLRATDWRAWIALAWVVWFGLLYGKMVLEERGEKLRAAISSISR